jgi:hypothetical protein
MKKYFSERVFFDHLHKTGGTALTDFFINNLGVGSISAHDSGEYYDLIRRYGGNYSIISAHCYFKQNKFVLDSRYKHITLFREPVSRALSYLKFIAQPSLSGSDAALAAYAKLWTQHEGEIPPDLVRLDSIEHFALMQGLSNIYVKHFCAFVFGDVDHSHLETSKLFISGYDVIGFQDDMDGFISQIEHVFGMKFQIPLRAVNVAPPTAFDEIYSSKKLINNVAKLNQFDLLLYEHLLAKYRSPKRPLFNGMVPKLATFFRKPVVFDVYTGPPEDVETHGELKLLSGLSKVKCNEEFFLSVLIRNGSKDDWRGLDDPQAVIASYHWYDEHAKKVVYGGMRTHIPQEVIKSGTTIECKMVVLAPQHSGSYTLELTILQECIQWFEDKAFIPASLNVLVVD